MFRIAKDHPDVEITIVVVDKKTNSTMAESTGESATLVLSIVSIYKMLISTGVHSFNSISNMVMNALIKIG